MAASTRQSNLFAAEDWKKSTRPSVKQTFKVTTMKPFVRVWLTICVTITQKISTILLNQVNILH